MWVRKKNAESCWRRIRHPGSSPTSAVKALRARLPLKERRGSDVVAQWLLYAARNNNIPGGAKQRWYRIWSSGVDSGRILRFSFGSGPRSKIFEKPGPMSSEISDLLLLVSYFAYQNKEIMFGNYFVDVCCVN